MDENRPRSSGKARTTGVPAYGRAGDPLAGCDPGGMQAPAESRSVHTYAVGLGRLLLASVRTPGEDS
jgi:hypothetical protein